MATVFLQSVDFIDAAYILAFILLIYGMTGLTGPRTAVRGNKIAAVGMAIAVIATLLRQHEFSRQEHDLADRSGARSSGPRSESQRRSGFT